MSDPNWFSSVPHEFYTYAWAVGVCLGSGMIYGIGKTLKKRKQRAIKLGGEGHSKLRKVSRTSLTIQLSKDTYDERG